MTMSSEQTNAATAFGCGGRPADSETVLHTLAARVDAYITWLYAELTAARWVEDIDDPLLWSIVQIDWATGADAAAHITDRRWVFVMSQAVDDADQYAEITYWMVLPRESSFGFRSAVTVYSPNPAQRRPPAYTPVALPRSFFDGLMRRDPLLPRRPSAVALLDNAWVSLSLDALRAIQAWLIARGSAARDRHRIDRMLRALDPPQPWYSAQRNEYREDVVT